MSIDTEGQAMLSELIEELGSVAVAIGGTTGIGLAPSVEDATEFSENGETGLTTGLLRVSAATFTKPAHGATIMIDGDACIVMDSIQTAGVIRIRYRKVRKVEGI